MVIYYQKELNMKLSNTFVNFVKEQYGDATLQACIREAGKKEPKDVEVQEPFLILDEVIQEQNKDLPTTKPFRFTS